MKCKNILFEEIDFINIFDFQKSRSEFQPLNKEIWNKKAKSYKELSNVRYYDEFFKRIGLNDVESVLDIGCGSGNLAVKFLEKHIKVTGLDYSEKMIEEFNKNTIKYTNVNSYIKSWEDDWSDIGIYDIAVISKSFEFENISVKDIIEKINNHVKKAVYLTYYVGNYLDDEIIDYIGRKIINRPNYILLLNVLYQMNIYATFDFIVDEKLDVIKNYEKFENMVSKKIDNITKNEKLKLKEYFEKCKNSNKPLFAQQKWAFISWKIT